MSVKRFVAADMRRALELVRQEMGPDAVILSSRRVKQGVEIVTSPASEPEAAGVRAALDTSLTGEEVPLGSDDAWRHQAVAERAGRNLSLSRTEVGSMSAEAADEGARAQAFADALRRSGDNSRGPASGKTPEQLAQEIERAREKMLAARRGAAQPAVEAPTEPAAVPVRAASAGVTASGDGRESEAQRAQLDALQSELADMRLLLEEQLSRLAQTPQQGSPQHSGLMRRLRHLGLTEAMAARVLAGVSGRDTVQAAWADTQATLAQTLPASSLDPVMQGGVYAFVGPTGAGKTTTIAKLAARYVLEHGPENVTLVTTDTYRLAAHDQLRSLGRILKVQVKVVDDTRDLPLVLRSLKHCPLVLVDTAGFRQGDAMLREQLEVLADVPEVKTLLVLSCNAQLQMMKASVHSHEAAGLYGCVLTKLDETGSLGEALSVVMEHSLTVYYSTDGQEIPQDLSVARGHRLVAAAVGLMTSGMGSSAPVIGATAP